MSKLVLRYNQISEAIELYFKDKELQNFLSLSITQNLRTWNKNNNCWVIIPDALYEVISYSRHLFNHIDSSSLPIMYQKIVQRALQGLPQEGLDTKSPTLNKDSSPYSVLYIREDAPDFIIKAVYKALVFEYHPDHGGNAEQFQTVKEAYEEIIGGAP